MTKNQAAVTCEDGSTIEEGTKYLGVRGGCNLPSKPNQWGNFSKVICTYTTAFPVMKVAEGYFLRAEGALRGWSMGGSAKDLYEEGIRISIKNELAYKGSIAGVTSISDAEIDAYLNGTSGQIDFVDPVKAENSIKAMNTLGVKWDEGAVDYALNRGFCGGMYENVYLHIFNNTRRLIASCDEQGLSDYGAMMRVVQAYAIQMLTDAYGPVAYSSVIEDPTGGASFSYDTQESVYNALFTLVDEAIAGFKGTASVADMQAFDYWCNGDIALWKKVANQLKLRLAMRIVKVNPTLAKQKAEEAVQGGVLTSADRDILINQGLSNELTRMFEWGDCGMNASLITMLEGFKDPVRRRSCNVSLLRNGSLTSHCLVRLGLNTVVQAILNYSRIV